MKHFHWSHEVYSLDLLYRSLYRYPRFLPLFIMTEHGINFDKLFDKEIMKSKLYGLTFFTWNSSTLYENRTIRNPKFIGQIHPWVVYKEKNRLKISPKRAGTVFFPFHTVPGIISKGQDDKESVRFLEEMNLHKPITVCLHWLDYQTERRVYFEDHGFTVTYAGHPNQSNFMDGFFKLVEDKKEAIVEGWSSAVPYLTDLGIPTRIINREMYEYSSDGSLRDTELEDAESRRYYAIVSKLYMPKYNEPTEAQLIFARTLLGYEFRENRQHNLYLIWLSLFIVGPQWYLRRITKYFTFTVSRSVRIGRRILRGEPIRSRNRERL